MRTLENRAIRRGRPSGARLCPPTASVRSFSTLFARRTISRQAFYQQKSPGGKKPVARRRLADSEDAPERGMQRATAGPKPALGLEYR